jgi:hypothetical protein
LSTKIHTLVDALGNPVGFFLTGGQVHDLVGADHLLPSMQADMLIADKAFDADERVVAPLAEAGKAAVIPPTADRRQPRHYDPDPTKNAISSRTSSPSSSSSVPSPPATIKPDETSSPPCIWPEPPFGSIDDRP